MMQTSLRRREHLLLLWTKDRLGEREAVEWAVTALKQIRGDVGAGNVGLFDFLDTHAQSADLPPTIKKVWRLLRTVARESAEPIGFLVIHRVKQKLEDGTL